MSTETNAAPATPGEDTLTILACLHAAVAEALERKRRLGQYSVQWTPEGTRLLGPDAPPQGSAKDD